MGETTRELLNDTAVAILCGGRGTRMGSVDRHKVCFPIDGVPGIVRTVKMFYGLGARRIVLVIGSMAESVISTVGTEFPQVLYAYQPQPLGTGHAAQIGVLALKNLGHAGPVLVTMGDKVIDPSIVRDLTEHFLRARADLAFITISKKRAGRNSTSGRIVTDRTGTILGNIELRDIQRAKIIASLAKQASSMPQATIRYKKVKQIGTRQIADEGKLLKALGPLGQIVKKAGKISGKELIERLGPRPGLIPLAGKFFTGDQVEAKSKTVNLSVYLARSDFIYNMLPRLSNDNAQQEFYLTEIINLAADDTERNWKLLQHELSDPSEVMAFNSPDELLLIEDTLRQKKQRSPRKSAVVPPTAISRLPKRAHMPAGKWLEIFNDRSDSLARNLAGIYGPDRKLIENRRRLFVRAIKHFIKQFGPLRKAIIVRAPGRINLLGRHVDHRGGAVNVMAIDRDVVFVAAARDDDVVTLSNAEPKRFPPRQFSLAELLGDMQWQDWLTYINSEHVRAIMSRTQGDWSNYIKASLLRIQQSFRNVRILGFDAAVAGDIPMASGLSSSSALVVASAEVTLAFNGLDITPSELVDLCGEGEWFVGSRGGSADHAAIRMSRRGQIAHIKFFPFHVARTYSFPENCRVIIAHSGIDARKSAAAKDKYNQKVTSYELGFMLLKDRTPQYEHLLEHVRDINPRRLNCLISQIYRTLLSVPELMPADELLELLSDRHRDRLDRLFASHRVPAAYDLRGVLLYGIAECERSLLAPEMLEAGRVAQFGRLMNISHHGDRIVNCQKTTAGGWRAGRFGYDCSDQALARLCDDLASEDPDRVLNAQLYMQPGAYGCSTAQIDKMTDVVSSIDGVFGAQLGGAGLGGCIMILTLPEAVEKVRTTLKRQYYQPAKIEPVVHVCQPVAGSGLITV